MKGRFLRIWIVAMLLALVPVLGLARHSDAASPAGWSALDHGHASDGRCAVDAHQCLACSTSTLWHTPPVVARIAPLSASCHEAPDVDRFEHAAALPETPGRSPPANS